MSSTPFRNQLERPITQLIAWRDDAIEHLKWRAFALSRFAGMDVMRINCAHDDPDAWHAMVENLRQAERVVGRHCRVQADLAGPKLRTGRIGSSGRVMRVAPRRDLFGRVTVVGRLWLTPADAPEPAPSQAHYRLEVADGLLDQIRAGDVLGFTDTRGQPHALSVTETSGVSCLAEIDRTAYIEDETPLTLLRDGAPLGTGRVIGVPEIIAPIHLQRGDILVLTRADEPGIEAVRFLGGILSRMDEHYVKRRPTLRRLSVAQLRAA